ncbi:hypothetical protein WDU94_006505, partial [Cyamophila willieti]
RQNNIEIDQWPVQGRRTSRYNGTVRRRQEQSPQCDIRICEQGRCRWRTQSERSNSRRKIVPENVLLHHARRFATAPSYASGSDAVCCRTKLPSDTPKKDKLKLIHEIQSMLGLTECRHTRTECLSGGQRKRLSIANELINNPPVLFLDEPTSGLDNVSTKSCLRLLRNLAHQGRTIVCTIHQPSALLFSFFDNVYVLAGGKCIYQGATEQLVPFMSSVGLKCPTHYNPADYVIELTEVEENITILSTGTGNGKHTRFKSIQQVPGTDQIVNGKPPLVKTDSEKMMSHSLVLSYMDNRGSEGKGCVNMSVSCWYQFVTLYHRMTLQILRNRLGLKIQFYHHLMCGLAVGIVFYGKSNDGTQFFNHMKFCMGVILFHVYTQCMVQVLLFPTEVKLLKKEYFNQWYGLKALLSCLAAFKGPIPDILLSHLPVDCLLPVWSSCRVGTSHSVLYCWYSSMFYSRRNGTVYWICIQCYRKFSILKIILYLDRWPLLKISHM